LGHLQPGMVLDGRFEVERHVADGGMGSIFRARDRRTGKWVAIKVLHDLGPEDRVRFFREARLLSELRHPRIVSYIANGSLDGEPYLALEWLEGHDLKSHLGQHGRLPLSTSLRVLRGLAEALRITHARGILHRDLKPTNVFLRGGSPDAVLLIDFGIAAGPGGFRITRTGMIVGTPEYMAPEQTLRAPRLGPETDIYAAGCVLFESLTGRPPFVASSVLALFELIKQQPPPDLSEFIVGVPPGLQALVSRMLAKEPGHRIPTADALLRELDALSAQER
jgi:serine/threonine protein kinase